MNARITEVRVTVPSPITAEDLTTASALAARYMTGGTCYLRALEVRPAPEGAPEQTDMVFTAQPHTTNDQEDQS